VGGRVSKGPWKKPQEQRSKKPVVEELESEVAFVPFEDADELPAASESIDKLAKAMESLAAAQAKQSEALMAMQRQIAAQAARPEARAKTREETRGRDRSADFEGVADRDGNILVRRSFESMDPFELPAEFLEEVRAEGYSLEWKSEFVYNQQQTTYLSKLMSNGHWRPVLNSRLPGRYPGEPDEAVRHEGMILMERPLGLTLQARREDERGARDQLMMRQNNWGVNSKNPQYFDPHTAEAEKHTLLRRTIEPTEAAWRPELQIAADTDL